MAAAAPNGIDPADRPQASPPDPVVGTGVAVTTTVIICMGGVGTVAADETAVVVSVVAVGGTDVACGSGVSVGSGVGVRVGVGRGVTVGVGVGFGVGVGVGVGVGLFPIWLPNSHQVALPLPSKSAFRTGYWFLVPKSQTSSTPVASSKSRSALSKSIFQAP